MKEKEKEKNKTKEKEKLIELTEQKTEHISLIV